MATYEKRNTEFVRIIEECPRLYDCFIHELFKKGFTWKHGQSSWWRSIIDNYYRQENKYRMAEKAGFSNIHIIRICRFFASSHVAKTRRAHWDYFVTRAWTVWIPLSGVIWNQVLDGTSKATNSSWVAMLKSIRNNIAFKNILWFSRTIQWTDKANVLLL
jgi:hypothetical protein